MFLVNVGFRVADVCISSSVFSLVKSSRTFFTVRFVCTELLYWTFAVLDWCFLHISREQCSWLIQVSHFSFSSGRAVGRRKSHLKSRKDILIQLGFDDHFSISGGQSHVGCNQKFQFTPGSRGARSVLIATTSPPILDCPSPNPQQSYGNILPTRCWSSSANWAAAVVSSF